MTPDQEEKLDELIQDVRDMRRDNASMGITIDIMAAQMVSLGKEVSAHEGRIGLLETAPRRMSASVTNEIGDAVGTAVGDSLRVAAPEVARLVAQRSIAKDIATGVVLAFVIVAALLLQRH